MLPHLPLIYRLPAATMYASPHSRPTRPTRPAVARLVRALLVPVVIATPPLFWVVDATRRATWTTLGRDQGIFQYVAWALRAGAVDYRDIRDVNGPLTHLIHLVLLSLGGADEHRFHVIDLAITGAVFALVGACIPGLASARAPPMLERVAWAFAGWVVLEGQYLLFGYWDLAQRESFFDWFLLPSMGFQLVALATWCRARPRPRLRTALLSVSGALSMVPWFGKPTYAFFTLAQIAVIALGAASTGSRRRQLRAFAIGGALGAAAPLAFLVTYGDWRAYAHIQLTEVPVMYRFIWPRAAADIFSEPWRATQAIFALVGSVVIVALVAIGEMPDRAVVLALAPLCALASVVVQAKGFPYHFHPVTATVHLQWLAFASWATERTRVAQRRLSMVRLAPVAFAAAVALRVATSLEDSPYVRAGWLLGGGAMTAQARVSRDYLSHFPEPDYFPFELREAAEYLRARTGPDDRVQTYGMDPYVLFLARRRSATPYIYAYDLNSDAALAGGTGGRPRADQAERIISMRDAHELDLLARLEAGPPAAFVFIDGSPLMSKTDAWDDFDDHCPRAAAWVGARYRETARFGHDHVWLRLDNTSPKAPPQGRAAEPEAPPAAP